MWVCAQKVMRWAKEVSPREDLHRWPFAPAVECSLPCGRPHSERGAGANAGIVAVLPMQRQTAFPQWGSAVGVVGWRRRANLGCGQCPLWVSDWVVCGSDRAGFRTFSREPSVYKGRNAVRVPPRAQCFRRAGGPLTLFTSTHPAPRDLHDQVAGCFACAERDNSSDLDRNDPCCPSPRCCFLMDSFP